MRRAAVSSCYSWTPASVRVRRHPGGPGPGGGGSQARQSRPVGSTVCGSLIIMIATICMGALDTSCSRPSYSQFLARRMRRTMPKRSDVRDRPLGNIANFSVHTQGKEGKQGKQRAGLPCATQPVTPRSLGAFPLQLSLIFSAELLPGNGSRPVPSGRAGRAGQARGPAAWPAATAARPDKGPMASRIRRRRCVPGGCRTGRRAGVGLSRSGGVNRAPGQALGSAAGGARCARGGQFCPGACGAAGAQISSPARPRPPPPNAAQGS